MDAVLMNRLDGDSVGPVKVLVSNHVYSQDGQHVLVPEGTIVLGEAKKIGSDGFGQQRRIAVAFHRMIMPDGYSVDLDQFHGLNQIGEEALKDRVNNHYLEIFGTSIALGVIAGAGQITQGEARLRQTDHRRSQPEPPAVFRSQLPPSWIGSFRFRRQPQFGRVTGSRSISPKTCFSQRTRTIQSPIRSKERLCDVQRDSLL